MYCAPLTDKTATCKGIDACFVGGGLFGLSYTKEQCYGTKEGTPANFCYFDNGGKVVDECGSCTEVEDCNAYQSQDSCEVNSCLTDKCKWVDAADNDALIDYSKLFTDYKGDSKFVTPETGRGYCVEEEYNNDDLCSLCSSSSTLLENYYCTADVCTALGRCFSNPPYLGGGPLSSCNSCGDVPTKDKTCYSYSTELECSNKNSVSLDPKGNVVASEDSCGWNVCAWDGTSCYKDGDANQKDDCNGLTGIQRAECKVDITPPVTATSGNTLVISSKYQNFTFKGTDTHTGLGQTNAMGVLGYCLSEATTDSCSADKFKEINYPGNLAEESIIVNLFNDLPKDAQAVKYRLKYYSKDVYGNKGSVEQVFLHVDTVNPSFIIKDKISTSGDKADITVYLEELNEQMQCNFGLTPVVPVGVEIVKAVGLNANKEVQFSGLVGARFDLKVECEDAVGNKNSKNETYVVDLEQRIEVISPSIGDVLSETSVTFVVKTTVDATCALHRVDTNEKVSNFLTDGVNLKEHKTSAIAGFTEGGYKGTHKVVCTDILIQQKMEKLLDFGIDFTAPVTNIELKEGDRIENPVGFGWEKSFVKSVEVSFNCVEEGFECEETKYCLGKSCEFKQDAGYKKFETTLTLNGSATICYYSKDKGGNEPIQPLCGEILIEGHGLTLEKPSRYYYEGEQWGISAEREFDLVFYTKVPTSTCKLGFTKGFDYTNVEPNRVLQNTNGKYSFLKFPGAALSAFPENGGVKTVFIKCEDVSGVVGPEHVVHLEYDPTIPVIEEAYANPSKVLEGTKTGLFAETDDKTQCRYSDNSEDTGSSDYGTMEFSFPDEDLRVLRKSHEDLFSFNFVGTTKNYKLNMQCKNGAEGISETEIVSFLVDYTATGNIIKASPIDGYFKPGNVSLELETSKTALCSYKLGEEYVAFANTNGKVHTSVIGASAEMTYLIPVRCQIGSHLAKGELKFTIDNTPPKITSVEEGNFTCGSDVIGVMVYSNETKTEGYAYELYDQGVALGYASYAKNNSKKVNGVLVNGTGGSELPIQLSTKDLEEGHKYKVKVWSWDAVGLTSQPVESDGIIVVPKNATECKTNKAPGIEVVIDSSSCTQAFAQIKCSGSVGCKNIKYGVDKTAIECLANKTYSGTSIAIESSAYVCYEAENYAGNILKGSKLVGFSDSDGDEVADSCDLCIGTISGESVDSVGCADGQVSEGQSKIDEDGDQLPDSWEKLNSRESCPLDYRQRDSNGNGISDGLEDYDNDGLTVYQEYVAGTDPCVADNLITPKTDDVGDILSTEDKTTSDSNILAWVLLLFGLLLIAGGVGYLIYYYKAKGEQVPVAPMIGMPRQEVPKQDSGFSLFGPGTKPKSVRRRTSLFTEFGRNSEVIPHVDKALSSGGSHQERVSKLAKNYVKNKEQIQPGLRPAEKGLFAKLEKIAGQQNSGKKINEIISSKQAKGIFGKLRELTKKRKQ